MNEVTYEFAHLGINSDTKDEAKKTAEIFSEIFGFKNYDIGNSIFSSGAFEIVKEKAIGTKGHIGIYTNDIELAIKDLESKNIELDYDTLQKKASGEYVSIYFKDEIVGFAFHLLQKQESKN